MISNSKKSMLGIFSKEKAAEAEEAGKPLPPPDMKDFRTTMPWRVFRIMAEFIEGWEFIADFKKSVTIFGSARVAESSHWYQEARKLGGLLAKAGYVVITGGGPGIMEGANRGASEAKGKSVGLNIQLPHEQRTNPYVNRGIGFHYFFTRKLMMTYSAAAYVYFPGGFGTLDEFFEMVTLIQEQKIATDIPLILVGKEYWGPLTKWIDEEINRNYHMVSPTDTGLYFVVDTAEEALKVVRKAPPRNQF